MWTWSGRGADDDGAMGSLPSTAGRVCAWAEGMAAACAGDEAAAALRGACDADRAAPAAAVAGELDADDAGPPAATVGSSALCVGDGLLGSADDDDDDRPAVAWRGTVGWVSD